MSVANKISAELKGDRVIWMVVLMLSFVSILAVYSATGTLAWKSKNGDTTLYLITHVVRLAFGLGLVYVAHLLHYQRYNKMAPYLLLIVIALLVFTLLFGVRLNEASRWISVGGISFQPSELAKIVLLIYVARELTRKQEYISSWSEAFVPIIVPVLAVCGLIAPANLSTAMVLFVTCLLLMFIGRVRPRFIFLLALLGVVVFAGLIVVGEFFPNLVRVETWISRVQDYIYNADGGYQVQQAKIAIANGGYLGVGPGNSISRNFLPYVYADFIYPLICEEYGLLGGLAVLGLYLTLFFRTVALVTRSPKAFGTFLAMGLSLSLVMQALANMAVSVHLVPATGLTLPMISMGGTSIIFTSIALGIILSVSKYIETYDE
ncbi:MAG: FtsW/RodA/SpoVE family cell cycle protein [Chitinophagales bacterium]|jgi:cell division protein FtsW